MFNQVAYGDYLEIAALQAAPGSSSTVGATVSRSEKHQIMHPCKLYLLQFVLFELLSIVPGCVATFGPLPRPPPLTPQLAASPRPSRLVSTLTRTRWWPPLWPLLPSPTQRITPWPAALGWDTQDSISTTGKTPADDM